MYEEDEYGVSAPFTFCYCSIGFFIGYVWFVGFVCSMVILDQAMHQELTRKAADVLDENEHLKKAR